MKQRAKFYSLFISVCLIFLSCNFSSAFGNSYKKLVDEKFHFQCEVPSNWITTSNTDNNAFRRFSVKSPDRRHWIGFYALRNKNDISLKRFSGNDRKLFNNIGDIISEQYEKKFILLNKNIVKVYHNNKKNTFYKACYTAKGSTLYVILAFSRNNNFDIYSYSFDSFKSNATYWLGLKDKFFGEYPHTWIGALKNISLGFFDEVGTIYILILWGFLFAIPIMLFSSARGAFKKSKKGKGLFYIFLFFIATTLIVLFLLFFGKEAVTMSVDKAGKWILGLIGAVILCIVTLPISAIGSQLKTTIYSKRSKDIFILFLGLSVLGVIDYCVYIFFSSKLFWSIGLIELCALVIGWYGDFMIPDIES